MKKLIILITLMLVAITTGCSANKDFVITSEDLSENESLLLTLTGNRVAKYNLKNLPTDKTFDLSMVYEVYKDGEKVKDDYIFSMGFAPTEEKLEDTVLAINIEDNIIRCMAVGALGYLPIEEDLSKLSYTFLPGNTNISIGDEIYLFQGSSSENGFMSPNSAKITDEEKEKYIANNQLTVFLKLVCK